MHFAKVYTQLLLTLPPDLRDNTIEYVQLKRLIKELINELKLLGLSPAVLRELLERASGAHGKTQECADAYGLRQFFTKPRSNLPKLVYEFGCDTKPCLRLRVKTSHARGSSDSDDLSSMIRFEPRSDANTSQLSESVVEVRMDLSSSDREPVYAPEPIEDRHGSDIRSGQVRHSPSTTATEDIIITLVSDTTFFQLLSSGIRALSSQLLVVHSQFITTLKDISRLISLTARPVTSSAWNQIFSKSDLYAWREMFQIYLEAEIFEGIRQSDRGERTVEESEKRLWMFTERLTQKGFGDKRIFKMKQSQAALRTFLELNVFILNLTRFQGANAEAIRKILKKHAKRTGLPLSVSIDDALSFSPSQDALTAQFSTDLFYIPKATASSPRILIQAIGETLLPLIPHLDDYTCLICTSIAFMPIRLDCGHFFCVRCLVKMQKRGQGDCPMCRAAVVLTADRTNVDLALRNFMQDWFPIETKVKRQQNEREAGEEQLREMGFSDRDCTIA